MNAKRIVSMVAGATLLAASGRAGAQLAPSPVGASHSLESRVAAAEAQLAALAPLLGLVESGHLEVVVNDGGVTVLRLTGINLQVRNGMGSSAGAFTNGAGNVIIGYDEVRTAGAAACSSGRYLDEASCVAEGYVWGVSWKTGSHYLVVGPQNNYGRTNGIVVGQRNSSSAPFASVLAGQNNAAAKSSASVCGGQWNTASGDFATVSGGSGNTASATSSVVSGGIGLVASTGGVHLPQPAMLVRTASGGAMDVAGTAWSRCYADEPSGGMSRLTTLSFGAGTFTVEESFFASLGCAGAPVSSSASSAYAAWTGYHSAGWVTTPPVGLPATVTAVSAVLTASPPGGMLPEKTLFFIDDLVSPAALHMGKGSPGPDGYPTTLEDWGTPRAVP